MGSLVFWGGISTWGWFGIGLFLFGGSNSKKKQLCFPFYDSSFTYNNVVVPMSVFFFFFPPFCAGFDFLCFVSKGGL